MTRIKRIDADLIRANPHHLRHLRHLRSIL